MRTLRILTGTAKRRKMYKISVVVVDDKDEVIRKSVGVMRENTHGEVYDGVMGVVEEVVDELTVAGFINNG